MDVKFLFGWAKENGIELPKNADGNINIPASFELYNEWQKKGREKESSGKLVPYSEHEVSNFSNSNRIRIARNDNDIKQFIEDSKNGKQFGKKLLLGKLNDSIAQNIKDQVGTDLTGFNVELRASDIEHILNGHSNAETENPRGQLPVTQEDIARYSEIIESFDEVKEGKKENSLVFIKRLRGNVYAVSNYSYGNKSLSLKTLYIIKK